MNNPNLNFNVYLTLNEITLDEINIENFDNYDNDVVEYISGHVVKSVGIHQSFNTCFKFVLKRSNDNVCPPWT